MSSGKWRPFSLGLKVLIKLYLISELVFKSVNSQRNVETFKSNQWSALSADGLAPQGAKASTGTVMTKCRSLKGEEYDGNISRV